jgi:hypothetical protein
MRHRFGLVAFSVLVMSCVQADRPESPNQTPLAPVAESAAPPSAAAQPTPPPAGGAAPTSAGSVPDAGVLFVIGADDGIYRYEGSSGRISLVWRASTFDRADTDGVYASGRRGGRTLLRWDGTTASAACSQGYASQVSSRGGCVFSGTDGIFVQLPGEAAPRLVLPADWGGGSPVWSPDGRRLLVERLIAARPGPGMDPGLVALWVLESDGRTRELYRPPDRGVLQSPRWSPDGRFALVRQYATTSNSFAADGVGTSLHLIEVATGTAVDLGIVMSAPQWGPRGQLAYVSGGGRVTWQNRTLVIREADGRERIARLPTDEQRVALAPAWDVARGRLAWISGPELPDSLSGGGYNDGIGPGQRVVVVEDGANTSEVRCGAGRVAEGVRWSSDGEALLMLCRKPGGDRSPLELWLYRLADGTSAQLVAGLVGDPVAGGFGYYGAQPSLFSIVAWSRALN